MGGDEQPAKQRQKTGHVLSVHGGCRKISAEPGPRKVSRQELSHSVKQPEDGFIRDFLQGDSRAVRRAEAEISRVVRFRGYYVPEEDRRDLIQEVLLQVCQALARPGFTFTTGFDHFVRSIAHRRCVDWIRRYRVHEAFDPVTPGDQDAPDDQLRESEQHALAAEILGALPERCRDLIRLHLGEGLNYRQIGEQLGCSEGAMRNQMYECLKKAREDFRRRQGPRKTDAPHPRSVP